ncbi:SAM-dependent methyltransferase [Acrocarpospora catenulata]|uniref:SAM-dependent methyltransferase n=1 Tax=Acrocarpospora catenulata TaxID=2836182 RepID=UPI001BDA2084|nr:SAM-dependent methyltransferase [Acrocarpospora catenulata]
MGEDPPTAAERRLDTSVPHPARVWDYWLGGTDNFPADREVGEAIIEVMPDLPTIARAERQFIGRAVRYLAGECGVDQFLDIGTGIPTAENVHQVAQSVNPKARIVYVDRDPIVLVHARMLLKGTPEGTTDYVDADLRSPDVILQAASETLNFYRPVALMILGVLEFIPDDTLARDAVRALVDGLAPGSYLAIASSVTSPSMDEAAALWNSAGATPIHLRSVPEVTAFFDGLELLPPGVVSLPKWHPGPDTLYADREVYQYGGIARKP